MDYTQVGIGVIGLFTLIVDLWAIVNAFRRPQAAFASAGKSKGLWLVLLIVGIFVCNLGFFVSLWYLIMVDPQVKQMERFGGGIGFPGGTGNFPT